MHMTNETMGCEWPRRDGKSSVTVADSVNEGARGGRAVAKQVLEHQQKSVVLSGPVRSSLLPQNFRTKD